MSIQKTKSLVNSEYIILSLLFLIVGGFVYLIFVSQFGYINDDWYLMYAAGAKDSSVFWNIFAIDRPLRALVMIPAYALFGANPIYYNLTAFLFRALSGIFFLWILRMLWEEQNRLMFWMALLFFLYPGFLSQPNAIDYLCHLAGLAMGMLSIGLTLKAIQTHHLINKFLFHFFSILLGWFYLSQIEWYIGLEFFRFACVLIIVLRSNETIWKRLTSYVQISVPAFFIPVAFLGWRLLYFESERGATDVDLHLSDLRRDPLTFLLMYASNLSNDVFEVLVQAWWLPLRRLSVGFGIQQWIIGIGLAFLVVLLLWLFFKINPKLDEIGSGSKSIWKREAFWLGIGTIIFGLLPVILVGRSVDFKNFSRYTLIACVGAAILLPLALSYIINLRVQNIFLGIFLFSATLTHYANGFVKASETQTTNNFWWQVSWRIPQLGTGTTLITHYSVAAEEDYFTWGPANLIYNPESDHEKYVQPAIYALLLDEDTIEKVFAKEGQDYSERRSIRTYPNYRNILILSQPTPESCVQVIDLRQVELSSHEDDRVKELAPYSEADQIVLDESFQTPPMIPFGSEPKHGWCYYYQKASYARQVEDWEQVSVLGETVFNLELKAQDQIEWMPFVQTYAYNGNISRLQEIASMMSKDVVAIQQACQILQTMQLDGSVQEEVTQLFCN